MPRGWRNSPPAPSPWPCRGGLGPVVLALPRDMLAQPAKTAVIWFLPKPWRLRRAQKKCLRAGRSALADAKRPLLLLGGSRWNERRLACPGGALRPSVLPALPVATSYRRAPLFDQTLAQLCRRSGLAGQSQTGGADQGQRSSDRGRSQAEPDHQPGPYTLFDGTQKLVHAYPEADELGRVFSAHLPIPASPRAFAAALDQLKPRTPPRWALETGAANAEYRAFLGSSRAPARRDEISA